MAAGGTGAVGLAALGPVLGLLAVTVGAEMLAQHQQDKKLKAISDGVQALVSAQEESTAAQLASAETAIRLAASAMLDQLTIPSTIGFGSARDGLRQVRARALTWLENWEKGAKNLPNSGGVNVEKMQTILAGEGPVSQWRSFPRRLETLYRALALDSRAQVLTHAEATAQEPGRPLHYLEAEVGKDLAENAAAQQRVQSLLWELAAHPLTYKMPWSGTESMGLDRAIAALASGMSRLPDAPQLMSTSGRQVMELDRTNGGDLRLVAPTADAAGL
ncbi:hypothetical protein ASG41_21945 [Modestobacter sp. Leaf380]|nr:hypothetical protein ASG41_21945 [Modestobacter sp. Leaf380]